MAANCPEFLCQTSGICGGGRKRRSPLSPENLKNEIPGILIEAFIKTS